MIRPTQLRAMALHSLIAAALMIPAMLTMSAQTAENEIAVELTRFGVTGGYSIFGYTADFSALPGVPSCCPGYEKGTGNAIALGLGAEMRFLPKLFGGVRVLFANYSGSLITDEGHFVTAEDDTAWATFRHTIEASQPAIATEAIIGYQAFPWLSLNAGLRGDLMLGGTYHQQEEIVTPATIRYENDLRQRLVFDGDIPQEKKLHMALIAGVRYDLPLNRQHTFLLSPEIQLWQGLGDLVDGVTWKMRGARLSLTLSFVGRDAERAPTPLAPGKRAEPETAKPAQETPTEEPKKPNSGASTNSGIPDSNKP